MSDEFVTQTKEALGTVIEIKLPDSLFFSDCFSLIDAIEQQYSRFLDSSELSLLNASVGKWFVASDELVLLLHKALTLNKQTDGCFDITVKSVLDRLGYDKEYSFVEKKKKMSLPVLGKAVSIDGNRVLLRKTVDFGGFGKGFALDKVASLLESKGVSSYYINAGGDIYARGKWDVLLEHPDDNTRAIGHVVLDGSAIASSCANRRRWGKSHHLIDASSKKSAMGMKAVFVIASKGIDADAYATALYTAGFDRAIELCTRLDCDVLLISPQNKLFKTDGFTVEMYDSD